MQNDTDKGKDRKELYQMESIKKIIVEVDEVIEAETSSLAGWIREGRSYAEEEAALLTALSKLLEQRVNLEMLRIQVDYTENENT